MTRGRHKKTALLVVGTGIGILFLWLAVRGTDIDSIGVALRQANWLYVPTIAAAAALFFLFKTIRWNILLSPLGETGVRNLFPVVVVGYASNIILPAQLGELVRSYLAGRRFRMPLAPVFVTVVIERVFDFLAILFFVALVIPFSRNVPDELVFAGYLCGALGISMMAVAIMHASKPQVLTRFVYVATRLLPEKLRDSLRMQFDIATQGLGSLRDWRLLIGLAFYSFVQWFCMGLATWLAILATGIQVPVSGAFVVLAIVVVGMTIPSSPGFFGTIQLCYTIGLAAFGIGAGPAVAASIVFHLVMFVSVAVGGLFFVHRMGYSARGLYRETTAAANRVRSDESRP